MDISNNLVGGQKVIIKSPHFNQNFELNVPMALELYFKLFALRIDFMYSI
jgi:hypothetical protein